MNAELIFFSFLWKLLVDELYELTVVALFRHYRTIIVRDNSSNVLIGKEFEKKMIFFQLKKSATGSETK